jgi:hypothetical protein
MVLLAALAGTAFAKTNIRAVKRTSTFAFLELCVFIMFSISPVLCCSYRRKVSTYKNELDSFSEGYLYARY